MPSFNISNNWQKGNSSFGISKEWSEEDALNVLNQLVSELEKDDSYLPTESNKDNAAKDEIKKIKVTPSQKNVLLEFINSIKDSVIKNHRYNP